MAVASVRNRIPWTGRAQRGGWQQLVPRRGPLLARALTGQIPSWWQVATGAIAASVVAPASDHLDFALRAFPAQTGDGCELAPLSPAPARADAKLTLLRSLYETVPSARSALVAALEQAARDPGELAGRGGALVVLSSGQSICSQLTSEQEVQRLEAATSSLRTAGVRVYPIRVGSDAGDPARRDANLRAIADKAATLAPPDPSGTPYWAPSDQASLSERIEHVTRELTACSFRAAGLSSTVDPAKLELYLGAQRVPFDARGEQAEGWGWADAAAGDVALYGQACSEFKRAGGALATLEVGCAE